MSIMENVNSTTCLAQNNAVQLLTFKVSTDTFDPFYAINVFKTKEVVNFKDYHLTELIGCHSLLEGTIVLRGMQVPILDLPAWLGKSMSDEKKDKSFILICDFNSITLGFRIQSAYKILERRWDQMKAPNSYSIGDRNLVINDTRLDDGSLCLVLDYERLLSEVIPSAVVDTNQAIGKHTQSDLPQKLKDGIVLIAEDSRTAQNQLKKIFNEANVPYKLFPDGKKLIDYLFDFEDNSHIVCIVTDIEMPEMSGFTVTKLVKEDPYTKHIPIIINSSMTGDTNKREALKLGADDFVPKIKSNDIIDKIINLL
jgi:two-component system chemotaxis response regulator CheV